MVQLVTLSHPLSIEEVKFQIPGLVSVDSSMVLSFYLLNRVSPLNESSMSRVHGAKAGVAGAGQ